MKKLLIILLFPLISTAQEESVIKNKEFGYKIEQGIKKQTFGVLDFAILVDKQNREPNELYEVVFEWVQITYENPEEVLLGQVEGKFLRIKGYAPGALSYPALQNFGLLTLTDLKYNITFRFKKGRIKVEIDSFEYFEIGTQNVAGYWVKVDGFKLTRKNGKPAKGWASSARNVRDKFNSLLKGLDDYLSNPSAVLQKDDSDW